MPTEFAKLAESAEPCIAALAAAFAARYAVPVKESTPKQAETTKGR